VGLQAVRGTWFTFLDDDDTCDPSHVSTLVAGAQAHADALVVYGCGRLVDAEGREQRIVGRPFNRALMHYTPLFYWQAALIRSRVRDLGCRFDPALAVCEDRDFLLQIASHGDFAFLPAAATFRFRPDLGTSGTGHGVNRDAARVARFDNLLRAKWAGAGELHNERAAWRCRAGVRAYFAGDYDKARAMFEQALAEYPDDPNALHGMARVALAAGQRDAAARYVRKAIDVNPRAAEFRATLAEIAPDETPARRETYAASRLATCSCGSGKRFKACCGSLLRLDSAPRAPDGEIERANEQRLRGNAASAATWFRCATGNPRASRDCLVAAARLELDLGIPDAALPLLERAAAIRVDTEVGTMLEECCALLAREQRDASLWSTTHTLIADSPARPRGEPAAQPVHIVVNALQPNSIDIANRMREALGERAAVLAIEPGSTLPMSMAGTCLVLVDDDLDFEATCDADPARVVVRMNHYDVAPLVRALARLRDLFPRAQLQFTRTCEGTGTGIARAMPVEYPWVDASLLAVAPPENNAVITVGRQGPAVASEDHPNDPALYRALLVDGHRVRVPPTPFLQRAFRDDAPESRPEFHSERSDGRPDAIPDVVFYRGRPSSRGGADARILAAMAAARPVVVFALGLHAQEWIEHGKSGFVVDTEDDARRCINALARDQSLRQAAGAAARRAAAALLFAQRRRARAFYFGVSVNE
ncbi:MAG TPA: tetratricopeptide repeat protein, partial [Casimicrobiaceae bacterium]|nr:tetratricopeptide repeat protein [Casimicrobiaceae bacterium]